MDTNLGAIELTEKQVSNLSSLKTENIKGFAYWHDKKEVVVVSMNELSEQDKSKLVSDIKKLKDEEPQWEKDKKAKIKKVQDALKTLGLTESDVELIIK